MPSLLTLQYDSAHDDSSSDPEEPFMGQSGAGNEHCAHVHVTREARYEQVNVLPAWTAQQATYALIDAATTGSVEERNVAVCLLNEYVTQARRQLCAIPNTVATLSDPPLALHAEDTWWPRACWKAFIPACTALCVCTVQVVVLLG